MTDPAYSLLLFSGLIAGPASAFIVDISFLPFYLIFPVSGLFGEARKGTLRILPLVLAPVFVLIWGMASGNSILAERSIRWITAVAVGASMSSALGTSRASELLFEASRKTDPAGLLESLAMVVSLTGPFSKRIKAVFIQSRKNGMRMSDSFTAALSSAGEMELTGKCVLSRQSAISAIAACLAWFALLAGIMEVL